MSNAEELSVEDQIKRWDLIRRLQKLIDGRYVARENFPRFVEEIQALPEYQRQKAQHSADWELAKKTFHRKYYICQPAKDARADEMPEDGAGTRALPPARFEAMISRHRKYMRSEEFKWDYVLVYLVKLLQEHSVFNANDLNEWSDERLAKELKHACETLESVFEPLPARHPQDFVPWMKYILDQFEYMREMSSIYELTGLVRTEEDAEYVRFRADCSMLANWFKTCDGYAAFKTLRKVRQELLKFELGSVVVLKRGIRLLQKLSEKWIASKKLGLHRHDVPGSATAHVLLDEFRTPKQQQPPAEIPKDKGALKHESEANPATPNGVTDLRLTWDAEGNPLYGSKPFVGQHQSRLLIHILADHRALTWEELAGKLGWMDWVRKISSSDQQKSLRDVQSQLETAFSRLRRDAAECWKWKDQLPRRSKGGKYSLNLLDTLIDTPPAYSKLTKYKKTENVERFLQPNHRRAVVANSELIDNIEGKSEE
jgi:hypothetical protein